jgi:hypothetical protein
VRLPEGCAVELSVLPEHRAHARRSETAIRSPFHEAEVGEHGEQAAEGLRCHATRCGEVLTAPRPIADQIEQLELDGDEDSLRMPEATDEAPDLYDFRRLPPAPR